MTKFT